MPAFLVYATPVVWGSARCFPLEAALGTGRYPGFVPGSLKTVSDSETIQVKCEVLKVVCFVCESASTCCRRNDVQPGYHGRENLRIRTGTHMSMWLQT